MMKKLLIVYFFVFALQVVKGNDELAAYISKMEKLEKAMAAEKEKKSVETYDDILSSDKKESQEKSLKQSLADDLDNVELSAKKSLSDLSTEDLVNELKKEIGYTKQSIEDGFHRKFHDEINEKKSEKEKKSDDKLWKGTLEMLKNEVDKREFSTKRDWLHKRESTQCVDNQEGCDLYKRFCEGADYRPVLEKRCARTCGYCKDCKDEVTNCKYAGSACELNPMIKRRCPQTCGLCKAFAPPKCSKSEHGCCWDKETTKLDAAGNNCPECVDEYKFVCKTFQPDCSSFNTPGLFMRTRCPKTCDLCSGDCKDDAKKAFYCPFWKDELKWCENKKDIMQHYCPKTCNYC